MLEYEIYLSFSLYDTKFCAACKLFFWSEGICRRLKMFYFRMSFTMKIVLNVTENGTNHKLEEQTSDIKH